MGFLKDFSRDERDLLISLPYRVGLWVSSSDATGGTDSNLQEEVALEKAINSIAQGMFESAFVHEIMAETFLRREDWRSWSTNVQSVPQNCVDAVKALQSRIPQRDIDAYRHILMQVGLEVARAFREYDQSAPLLTRIIRGISIGVDRIFGIMHGEKYVSEDLLNISYEEDLALNELAKALRGAVDPIAEGAHIIANS
ncbi:MAG: hypothetical protein ACXW30_03335 [Micavibrio sp.]